ncbi:MAG: hypothetical protein IKD73_09465 [Selenomonadaceae bacterium]|nr:hypothetical protein [Selenomonadaceae bacterium]
MSTTYNIKLGLGYEGTDFERKLEIKDVATADAATETVRAKVKGLNESLAGGTADGLDDFFRSDDYDASQDIGKLKAITTCEILKRDVTKYI